ncbi:hypothetical protein BJ138DRAFT_1122319 [Hygrophoropsis aurantiaca]|uniref:Uncharacterized protein n=1 Tax=Hygrophoropsis aurantiaca TaxID=72124 RepID=A0ACB8AS71_9AGAM|nr:hypothetical protein BJ138DRAFT_1122319 [Hygrophoropsis aurantiaca]
MSVATKNPFAILDEESEAPAPPPAAAAAPQPPAAPRANQKPRGGPASRGGRYYARGGAANAAKDQPGDEPPVGTEQPKRRFDGERGERGDRRGRGRGGPRGRGRPFDRHSQTGKTDSDKKVHQSWGGDDGNAELKAEEAADGDAAAETVNNDWAAPADGAAPADDAWGAPPADGAAAPAEPDTRRREREPEEEDNTLTLEQYLAQQKEKESALVPKLEARKANEGADDTLWDGVAPLKKDDEEAYFAGKAKSAPKSRGEKKEKVFIEIEARFDRPSRGGPRGRGGDRGDRGDRGERGRGGGRGRGSNRGRGGASNGYSAQAVNVADTTAFPSLS